VCVCVCVCVCTTCKVREYYKKTTNSKTFESRTVKFSRLCTEVRTREHGFRFPPFQHQTVSSVAMILYWRTYFHMIASFRRDVDGICALLA
jgi:hypothetical protein